MSDLFKSERPAIALRGIHLDLKGVPPAPARLVELLDVFAAARYNVVLVEWEDTFPWTVDERFRGPTAYTDEHVRLFCEAAEKRDIDIIPLVQCLGHMETPLSVAGYEKFREVPDDPAVLNALADGASDLVWNMVEDVLRLVPQPRYFHLGGDEARSFGTHPDTKAYIEKYGKGALYLKHVGPIMDRLNERGVRPILWHDMMIAWDDAALKDLAAMSDLMAWGYNDHPDTTVHHFNTKYIKRFHELGLNLWGAAAYKGADGQSSDLPDVAKRQANAEAWTDIARRFGLIGVVATAWSRYSTHNLQCEPIDSSLDSLFNVGAVLHDGCAPRGGMPDIESALDEIGEGARFRACREAMRLLAAVRDNAWKEIKSLKEFKALQRMDHRRACQHTPRQSLKYLGNIMKTAEEAELKVRRAFDGLMEPVWIEEYLTTRLTPLRAEYEAVRQTME